MTRNQEILIIVIIGGILYMAFTVKAAADTKAKISKSVDDGGFDEYIQAASGRFGIPIDRIKAHITIESAGNPLAVGSAGERGLMQLKPGALTDSKKVSHESFTFDDMFDPEKNIISGTAYLKWIEKYFFPGDFNKASRAYNQGVGGVNSPLAFAYFAKLQIAELA
jgi:soluble lytic murein transglycosylase-like protein